MADSTTTTDQSFGDAAASPWAAVYGERHRPQRILEFPTGISPPQKVRLYRRGNHYLLQWWDRACKKTLSERVDGDLLDAIVLARRIDTRLATFGNSGRASIQVDHEQLVAAFINDLRRRCDAGEIDPNSVERYRAPLERHYLEFAMQPSVARRYRLASSVDRHFRLEFSQFLQSRTVSPNGSERGAQRPMRGQAYVLDVVRSMFHWASDQLRGGLLPTEFQNPFSRSDKSNAGRHVELSEPDITLAMATALLRACDEYQLPIFATLALYGLRPNELGWIFKEDINNEWLRMGRHPDLFYETKGRRDKQLPVIEPLQALWRTSGTGSCGLLFTRKTSPLKSVATSKQEIITTFQSELSGQEVVSARNRRGLRDRVLRDFGQLRYDDVETEYKKLARKLDWPPTATLKDFRHLFATSMENAGVPEGYRRYLMGHSPGRATIVGYTHLNKLHEHFSRLADTELKPLVDVLGTFAP